MNRLDKKNNKKKKIWPDMVKRSDLWIKACSVNTAKSVNCCREQKLEKVKEVKKKEQARDTINSQKFEGEKTAGNQSGGTHMEVPVRAISQLDTSILTYTYTSVCTPCFRKEIGVCASICTNTHSFYSQISLVGMPVY